MLVDVFVQLLQEKNLSAYKLSQDTGIPQSLLSNYKSGKVKPSSDMLTALADYLDVSVDYLLGRTDNPNVNK